MKSELWSDLSSFLNRKSSGRLFVCLEVIAIDVFKYIVGQVGCYLGRYGAVGWKYGCYCTTIRNDSIAYLYEVNINVCMFPVVSLKRARFNDTTGHLSKYRLLKQDYTHYIGIMLTVLFQFTSHHTILLLFIFLCWNTKYVLFLQFRHIHFMVTTG